MEGNYLFDIAEMFVECWYTELKARVSGFSLEKRTQHECQYAVESVNTQLLVRPVKRRRKADPFVGCEPVSRKLRLAYEFDKHCHFN